MADYATFNVANFIKMEHRGNVIKSMLYKDLSYFGTKKLLWGQIKNDDLKEI
jgi:hypothetical protein